MSGILRQIVAVSVFMALLLLCAQPGPADAATNNRQHLYQLLKDGKDKSVRSLPGGEREILMALLALKAGRTNEAISLLKSAKLARNSLAALIRAEAYRRQSVQAAIRAGVYAHAVKGDIKKLERADLSIGLDEAETRLQAFANTLNGHIALPFDLLELGSKILNVFMVDKSKSRLSIYRQDRKGKLKYIADATIATDANTPVGIYRLGGRQASASLAYPLDYPNALDQMQGKSFTDVLMHTGQKPQGGILIDVQQLQAVEKHIRAGRSWLVIGENLVFDAAKKKKQLRDSIFSDLKSWRKDWESLNANAYLSHYHPQFKSDKHDYTSWSRYKRRVNRKKSFIKVKLSDFAIIRNPDRTTLGEAVLIEFHQRYKSSNYSASSHKRLYLARNHSDDHWKIISEREVSPQAVRIAGNSQLMVINPKISPESKKQVAEKISPAFAQIWAINLGSFDSESNADNMVAGIQLNGEQQPYVANVSVQGKQRFRVQVGFYNNKENAVKSMINICRQQRLSDCWLEHINR